MSVKNKILTIAFLTLAAVVSAAAVFRHKESPSFCAGESRFCEGVRKIAAGQHRKGSAAVFYAASYLRCAEYTGGKKTGGPVPVKWRAVLKRAGLDYAGMNGREAEVWENIADTLISLRLISDAVTDAFRNKNDFPASCARLSAGLKGVDCSSLAEGYRGYYIPYCAVHGGVTEDEMEDCVTVFYPDIRSCELIKISSDRNICLSTARLLSAMSGGGSEKCGEDLYCLALYKKDPGVCGLIKENFLHEAEKNS